MTRLFISDLHLDPRRPQSTKAFVRFLDDCTDLEALYILGDFVEAWIGDDDTAHGLDDAFQALAALAGSGVPCYLMHGNRDFLMGPAFAAQYGLELLPDPTVIDLYGEPTLLMHGDTLCTDDTDYQQFRRMVRDEKWQADFLSKPLAERRAIVEQLRTTSREANQAKAETIMDVNEQAVMEAFREHGVRQLIHGHTHRPAEHTLSVDGRSATRWVLGDWYESGVVLRCDEKECRLETIKY